MINGAHYHCWPTHWVLALVHFHEQVCQAQAHIFQPCWEARRVDPQRNKKKKSWATSQFAFLSVLTPWWAREISSVTVQARVQVKVRRKQKLMEHPDCCLCHPASNRDASILVKAWLGKYPKIHLVLPAWKYIKVAKEVSKYTAVTIYKETRALWKNASTFIFRKRREGDEAISSCK